MKYLYCTIFHSILQNNISLHHDIYCDPGLPYYTHLFTLTNHNFLFSLNAMMMFCSLVIITSAHIHKEINKEFFLCPTVAKFATTVFSYQENNLKFITLHMYLHT